MTFKQEQLLENKVRKIVRNVMSEALAPNVSNAFLNDLTKLCKKYQVVIDGGKVYDGNLKYVRYDSVGRDGKLIVDFEFND